MEENVIRIIISWFQPNACAQIVSGEFYDSRLFSQPHVRPGSQAHITDSSPFQRYTVSKEITVSTQKCVYKCMRGGFKLLREKKMFFYLFTDNVLTEIDLFLAWAWTVCCPISDHMITFLSIRIFKFSNSRVYLKE